MLLLAFPRVFISRHIFWKHLPTADFAHVKTCFQEGVELMGCFFVAAGAVRCTWHILHYRETGGSPAAP